MHAVSPSPSCLLLCCYLNIPLCPAHCFIQMIRLLCWIQRTLLLCRQANLFSQVSWCHVQLASEIKLLLVPTSFSLLSRVLSHGKACFKLHWYSSSIFGCLWPQNLLFGLLKEQFLSASSLSKSPLPVLLIPDTC